MFKGLDVSSYQPVIDYTEAAKVIDFVILRAGFTGWGKHSLNKDDCFEKHYAGFKKAGVPVGVYYYSCADTKDRATKEADYFLSLLKDKTFEYPVYMDVEDSYHAQKVSKKDLSDVVLTFCHRLEKAGYYVGVYANSYWWRNELDMEVLKHLDRWVAHYGVKTPAVQGEVWQHTASGNIPGIKGLVDLNYSYRDYPALIKKVGLNGYGELQTPTITIKGVKGTADDNEVAAITKLLTLLGYAVTVS